MSNANTVKQAKPQQQKKSDIKPITGLEYVYLQYLLVSGLYMLEPWERNLFNAGLVSFFSIAAYFAFSFGMPKVTVQLEPVGDAPILKQRKFTVDTSRDIAWFTRTVRQLLQLGPERSLFLYVQQCFAPSPDHTFQVLLDCYGTRSSTSDPVLHIQYSTTEAWG